MSEADQPHSLLRLNIVIPFALVTLIWGSTWLVIKDQLGDVPPSWSVTWRFVLAAGGMALFALTKHKTLRMDRAGHNAAFWVGMTQFFLNYNLVYRAEEHVTSGIVAVLFALLMLPNAVLARIFLGQPITRRFLAGTAIALVGIGFLLLHELRDAPDDGMVWLGFALSALAILSASTSNVVQAAPSARHVPVAVMLAWAMGWGALADFIFAWVVSGPPVLPLDARYLGGVAYLALLGSVLTFPLYFALIREIGAGRAAYSGVAVPVAAMILSTAFEGYRWTPIAGLGAGLAMLGLIVALRARKVKLPTTRPGA